MVTGPPVIPSDTKDVWLSLRALTLAHYSTHAQWPETGTLTELIDQAARFASAVTTAGEEASFRVSHRGVLIQGGGIAPQFDPREWVYDAQGWDKTLIPKSQVCWVLKAAPFCGEIWAYVCKPDKSGWVVAPTNCFLSSLHASGLLPSSHWHPGQMHCICIEGGDDHPFFDVQKSLEPKVAATAARRGAT